MKNLFTLFLLITFLPVYSQTTQLKSSNQREDVIHFSYPTVFVHGLNSDQSTWNKMAIYLVEGGWEYGDNFRFNLNYDGNNYSCDLFEDYKSFADENNRTADFYLANFNTDRLGNTYDGSHNGLSNQAAIVKQGLAVRDAVRRAMDLTGRNKVVLFGHSMGGLAIRQYLQNRELWQFDGQHHVAKVITTGTPHRGSNKSLSVIGEFVFGIDEQSEAVRDLRESYFYSGNNGVFLYGGFEYHSVMDDALFSDFYNVDVNCNSKVAEQVPGLNKRGLPSDLEYSYIVGNIGLLTDGVVDVPSATFQTLYPAARMESITVDTRHDNLTQLSKLNLQMMDEPDDFSKAYEMPLNTTINGYITNQGQSNYAGKDFDVYKLDFPSSGTGRLSFGNAGHPDMTLSFRDVADTDIVYYETKGTWEEQQEDFISIEKGELYLNIASDIDEALSDFPYYIHFDFFPDEITSTIDLVKNDIKIYPNPTTGTITLQNAEDVAYYELTNLVGQQLVIRQKSTNQLHFDLASGIYFLNLYGKDGNVLGVKKLIME